MNIFFEPLIKQNFCLNEEESRHAVKVLRLAAGDLLNIVDGQGGFYTCNVKNTQGKKCELTIVEEKQQFGIKDFYTHLIIAPTKNMDRMEWMLEKCVEIGIDEISFIQTRYSERKEIKTQRLEKIVIGAMKQSQKAYLPKINEMISWKEFLKNDFPNFQKMIAHLEVGDRKLIQHLAKPKGKYAILIGPEGDFSPDEIKQALGNGFQSVTLGNCRLRTETAGMVVCHTLSLINE